VNGDSWSGDPRPTVNDLLIIVETTKFQKWVENTGLRSAVDKLCDELRANPEVGAVIPKGAGLRKVRMAGLGVGKSGGFRVIYLLMLDQTTAVLMTGYSKAEKGDLKASELKQLVKDVATLTQEG
jgi:hypothetical protein